MFDRYIREFSLPSWVTRGQVCRLSCLICEFHQTGERAAEAKVA